MKTSSTIVTDIVLIISKRYKLTMRTSLTIVTDTVLIISKI